MSVINYPAEFGRAVAQFKRENFKIEEFLQLYQAAGGYAYGSNGERDAIIGAYEELRRLDKFEKAVREDAERQIAEAKKEGL